ncbi:hypothetical protein [Streptomyces sp. NPDC058279]|uniref:hypothetical protein n=1 Tax=Streptomyces sp. NPDC058279 TaxID=3346418 RepID=UPI0036EEF9AD
MKSLPFPDDLIRLQQRWTRTYNLLALRPDGSGGGAGLRRELIRLSCRISAHPYWRGGGYSGARRVELRRAAEAASGGERELVVRYVDGAFAVSDPVSDAVSGQVPDPDLGRSDLGPATQGEVST